MKGSAAPQLPLTADEDRLRQAVEEALRVGEERRQILVEIRTALEQGDDRAALALVRRIVGLPPVEAME